MLKINDIGEKILQFIPRRDKKSYVFGLDIGSCNIKLVKIDMLNSDAVVSALGTRQIKNQDIKAALGELLAAAGIESRSVNVGLSGKEVLTRCIMLPDMNESEFKNSMKYEAAKHIPFPVNEVVLDSAILKHNLEGNKMLVLIAAVKKDFVQRRLDLISGLGLEVNVLDIDSVALTNIFNFLDTQQNKEMSAVLNIGARISNLSLLDSGSLRFNRDILFGSADITNRISVKLGIGYDEAEKIKVSYDEIAEAREPVESLLAELVGELRLSFDYYESNTGRAVNCAYLTGGGSLLGGIDKFMSRAMGIDFKIWNPFDHLKISDNADKENCAKTGPCFAVAAGLALRK
ncbi:MAG: hypothetical protein COV72_05065 [Candidatus Omnitrophica bacterium CG11_big_fil_rev_8_21_14_0_20_42_13]|uniref:SHS2 domain-containing protein n=1 Tax=Candidatus Ghiorseimicrobium undicola TaxID=1974746 RepID=A0A2H0LZC7_9BACT|nr:MAG: hypothetical protein COV72_05065 [Candidatus Omnitrophica bacterium CG11_big_fil_rev_8_21_14_0_20_42_13]